MQQQSQHKLPNTNRDMIDSPDEIEDKQTILNSTNIDLNKDNVKAIQNKYSNAKKIIFFLLLATSLIFNVYFFYSTIQSQQPDTISKNKLYNSGQPAPQIQKIKIYNNENSTQNIQNDQPASWLQPKVNVSLKDIQQTKLNNKTNLVQKDSVIHKEKQPKAKKQLQKDINLIDANDANKQSSNVKKTNPNIKNLPKQNDKSVNLKQKSVANPPDNKQIKNANTINTNEQSLNIKNKPMPNNKSTAEDKAARQAQANLIQLAIKNFNPWDLPNQTKKDLLKIYKNMPTKYPNETKYMPIVQDYDKQIRPIIEQFQKDYKLINYQNISMTDSQIMIYKQQFNKKLKQRLIVKRKQVNQKANFKNNPNSFMDEEKQIKRHQYYEAFQYTTLVGVDLNADQNAKQIAQKQIKIFQQKYKLSKFQRQINLCIVVPTYNNGAFDRYLWNIESILQQNYTNYRVAIIDDASTDNTTQLIAKHLKWRNIAQDKVVLYKGKKNRKQITSIFYGSHKICNMGEIQYVIDGDDELVGRQVFKVINAQYQKGKFLTIYSNHIITQGTMKSPRYDLGPSKPYWKIDIQTNNFRLTKNRGYYHLRTMISEVVLLAKPQSYKDWEGNFYQAVGDNAVYYPAMEMSCQKVKYLPQIFYLYHYNTGQSQYKKNSKNSRKMQIYHHIERHINEQKPYRCLALDFMEFNSNIPA